MKKTGLAKIDLKDLKVSANGGIPGFLLNQFSMDEYQGNLRIATTVGQGMFGAGESANDVYILDQNLKQLGSVLNLGLGERIYSARFIGNQGYLVTFKQTDPFYILDLADPKNPQKKGELKIPGFSSYLHPLKENLILGVGREDAKVKLSLFDVSNPAEPVEIDKYSLDEGWTGVESNHHAFLQDDKHTVFFLPGGKGGYVFGYDQNKLTLKKAIGELQADRAVYIGDNLYLLSDDRIVVLDETNWEVKERLVL